MQPAILAIRLVSHAVEMAQTVFRADQENILRGQNASNVLKIVLNVPLIQPA